MKIKEKIKKVMPTRVSRFGEKIWSKRRIQKLLFGFQ